MMKFDKLLKNKYLHYAAVALMVINVLGYVAMGSIECILVLGGAAYLAQHFTKNRTADIFIGLFVANILFGCGRLREGMKGEKAHEVLAKGVALAQTDQKKAECDAKKCPDGCDAQGQCKAAAALSGKAAAMGSVASDAAKAAEATK